METLTSHIAPVDRELYPFNYRNSLKLVLSDKYLVKPLSDHHQILDNILMGKLSWSGLITYNIILLTTKLCPSKWQNCTNNVCSVSLADVQPIIAILGLKKTGRAYFVTFGALVDI